MNCDGAVDTADIDGFVAAITGCAYYAQQYPDCDCLNADLNGDSAVDTADIDAFSALVVAYGGGQAVDRMVYTYDAENRLTSVAPAEPLPGDRRVSFAYDYLGRRVRKTTDIRYLNGTWLPESDRRFVYDGWRVVREHGTFQGSPFERSYTWGPDLAGSLDGAGGIGGLLAVRDGAGQSPVPEPEPLMQSFMLPPGGGDARNYIYQYDAGGNVGQMLDLTPTTWNAAAVMVARYDYDAYGKVVAQAGSFANQATNGNAFQFNTKYLDAETGLNYYGHRYYSARLGRWTTRDPLGEAGGLNLYGFVGNDPVNGIDPLGLANQFDERSGRLYCQRTSGWWLWRDETHEFLIGRLESGTGNVIFDQPDHRFAFSWPKGALELLTDDSVFGDMDTVEQLMSRAAWVAQNRAPAARLAGVRVFDKEQPSLGWHSVDEIDAWDDLRLATRLTLEECVAQVQVYTETAHALTCSALTVPAGAGANLVDLATLAVDAVRSGDGTTLGGTALFVAGAAVLRVRLADDIVSDCRPAVRTSGPRCPAKSPTRVGGAPGEWMSATDSMSRRAAAYQAQITGRTGQAYVVNGVQFDGMRNNVLIDAKGPGYINFVKNGMFQPWFTGQDALAQQAARQVQAAGGAHIQWHIAEQHALPAFQSLFRQYSITGIQLIHTPVAP